MRILATVLLASTLALPAGAAEAHWLPVPGAPEVEVELAGATSRRELVSAWVRYAGSGRMFGALALQQAPRGVHRSMLHAEVDCRRRSLRVLAAQGHGSRGDPLFMSSVPGPWMAAGAGDAAGWLHDALCELARARQRE
jgi:hypothetical protein